MITLAICDDDPQSRETLVRHVRCLQAQQGALLRLFTFCSAESLLACTQPLDILLLDVQMGPTDGITAARILRQRGAETFIILVTNYIQYAIDGYEVQAFHFLKKPVEPPRFEQVVGAALRLAEQRHSRQLTVKADDQLVTIPCAELLYCETGSGCVLLHTKKRVLRCFSTMSQLEKQLCGQDFFRCHTAYLVNLAAIERLLPTEIELKDGALLPVSKHRKKAFRAALTAFWGDDFL